MLANFLSYFKFNTSLNYTFFLFFIVQFSFFIILFFNKSLIKIFISVIQDIIFFFFQILFAIATFWMQIILRSLITIYLYLLLSIFKNYFHNFYLFQIIQFDNLIFLVLANFSLRIAFFQ